MPDPEDHHALTVTPPDEERMWWRMTCACGDWEHGFTPFTEPAINRALDALMAHIEKARTEHDPRHWGSA